MQAGATAGREHLITEKMNVFFVYVLVSESKEIRFYVGMTADVEKRVAEHNSGKTKSTKAYLAWKLFFLNLLQIEKTQEKEKNITNRVLEKNP